HLVRTGQLDSYLTGYFRLTQLVVHPDKGGDTGLSAMVNAAYTDIRRNPGKVKDWVASMQNGNGNAEHIAVIDALVEKVETLQGVEKRYEELQRKYAELLAGGSGVDASVKKARRTETPRTSRAAPRVPFEEPEVRTPPRSSARRVDPEAEPVPVFTKVDPILIDEIVCVGSDGKVFERHGKLLVDGDVVRKAGEFYDGTRILKHMRFTPYQAISYLEKHGKQLPDYPSLCGVLEYVFRKGVRKRHDGTYEVLDANAKAVLDQFKNYGPGYGWHAINGVVDGKGDRMIHHPHDSDFPSHRGSDGINAKLERIVKPFKRSKDWSSCRLESALEDKNKVSFLKDLTGRENLNVFLELSEYFEREPWFYPPSKEGTWSAWLGWDGGLKFVIYASGILNLNVAARGVRRP
ncbi:MAG: hypothetical protein KKD17_04430, partial [Nanoarchaeota archaeon]|nr:hypothetical protein [Nanoarchaeota archaeon]